MTLNSTNTVATHLKTTLKKVFGFDSFREGQEEAILSLMTEKRLLCILPTGYGKSLLYQLPACLLDGMTIVISPLLALMRDQISHLNKRFHIAAAAINSDQSEEENQAAYQAAIQGTIKILFIAPEQLDNIDRFEFLLNLDIELVVVDEAHCISTWGHDFRPSYRQILNFLHAINKKKRDIKILALTATANRRVENDIRKQLLLSGQETKVLRQTMNRPNIHLSVIKAHGIAHKLAICEGLLRKLEGCGLIYCSTRENTELVAEYLKDNHFNVAAYHAGFETSQKRQLQEEFIADTYKALVATNALGMGIDKGNLRFIIHFDVPGSITAYYQEVGRCGRDGKKAEGILIYDKADKRVHDYFIFSAVPTHDDFQKVIDAIAHTNPPPGLLKIKTITGLHPTRVTIIVAELAEQGFITKKMLDRKQVYHLFGKQGRPDLSRYDTQREVKLQELTQILNYGEAEQRCRMEILRLALGDENANRCGCCDLCQGEVASEIVSLPQKTENINLWIDKRPLPIQGSVREQITDGISALDSKMRSPLFMRFMHNRMNSTIGPLGMDEELLEILKEHIKILSKKYNFTGLIPIPSRTWQGRLSLAAALAEFIKIPVLDILEWNELPPKRQGELLNNDQRHDNVHLRMGVKSLQHLPKGNLILFDDYVGSGNTIREAARAIKTIRNSNQQIVPFAVASLKWHLGKPGFA